MMSFFEKIQSARHNHKYIIIKTTQTVELTILCLKCIAASYESRCVDLQNE